MVFKSIFITLFWSFLNVSFASIAGEAEFIEQMSQHSSVGIALAEKAIGKSENKDVRKLAERLLNNQKKNQEKLNDLRSKWYSEVKVPQSANQVSIDISSLDNVDASQFDKTFLDLAAKHHRSGVEKLGKMMPNIDRRATHHLAVKIIKKEGSDVARIESLQKTIK